MGLGLAKEGKQETVQEDLESNTLNELQILAGHSDIVRLLVKIDDFRIASAGDDNKVIIWHVQTGQRLFVLEGHTRPVTCLLMLDSHTLVSGSSDKALRIWDVFTGNCLQVVDNAHDSSVRALAMMPKGTRVAHNADNATTDLFCSGSNDSKICVWGRKNDGISLIASIVREEEENLHCLLALHNCVVTASTSPYLYVYSLEEMGFCKKLAYHRESVRCLATITPSLFASASLDGSIVVWQSSNLQAFKVLEYPENYIQEKDYVFAVNHILPLGERYLAAAINDGFRVYDIPSATCVMQCKKAHDATVNRLIPLYNGTRIASCSVDSSIKLWGTAQALDFTQGAPNSSGSSSSSGSGYKKSRGRRFGTRLGLQSTPMLEPVCLGEMLGHSGAVYSLLPCSNESFASCGADGLVILWKDGIVQSEMRNRLASAALYINLLESRAEQEDAEQEIDEQVEEEGEEEEEEPSGGLEGNVHCEYINVGGEGAAVEEDSKIAGLAKEEHAPKTLLQDEEIVSQVDAVVLTDSSANTRTVF